MSYIVSHQVSYAILNSVWIIWMNENDFPFGVSQPVIK